MSAMTTAYDGQRLAAIPAGNWYVKILAANCNWELIVEKVT
ncbi:MAG: hypothetical protein QXT26_08040 [Thermoproteota archaeon]